MANSDKNILITPSVGLSTNPTIRFNGANNTPTTLRVLDDGTVSFEGTAGQLFSISDGLTGSIFSVNDISGIPSIEALDTGLVKLNQYGGSTVFGSSAAIQNSSLVNAKVSISTASASTPGLIIKAVSSQTANLQEWQDSSGTLLFAISSGGDLNASGTNKAIRISYLQNVGGSGAYIDYINTSNSLTVLQRVTTAASLIVKGAASQTADLQQWQNSAGSLLGRVTASGNLQIAPNNGAVGYSLFVTGAFTGTPVVLVRGVASQTADLQQWQNSSSTTLLRVNNLGQIQSTQPAAVALVVKAAANLTATITNAVGNGTTVTYTAANTFTAGQTVSITGIDPVAYNLSSVIIATATTTTFTVTNAATGTYVSGGTATTAQSGFLQQWQIAAGSTHSSINQHGALLTAANGANDMAIFQGSTGTTQIVASGAIRQNANLTNSFGGGTAAGVIVNIGTFATTNVGLRINGIASQTGDLTQWRNSAGTVLAKVQSGGEIQSLGFISSYNSYFYSGDATATPIRVIGAASQTANLTEWQNSSGTVLSRIDNSGNAVFLDKTVYANQLYVGNGNYLNATMHNVSGGAADIRLLLRAHPSQTANIQEWQDSAGTVLSKVTSNGSLHVGGGAWTTINSVYGQVGIRTDGALLGSLSVGTGNAGVIGLVVKGAASQTANLQEWQNSDGTVLTKIDSSGRITSLGGDHYFSSSAAYRPNIHITNTTADSNGSYILFEKSRAGSAVVANDILGVLNFTGFDTATYAGSAIIYGVAEGTFSPTSRPGKLVFATVPNSSTTMTDRMTIANSGTVTINGFGAAAIGLIVKGAASQTADLQQWQNSAGTVLAKIAADGAVSLASGGVDIHGAGANFTIRNAGTTAWYLNSSLLVGTGYSAGIGVIIRGNGSQTADLQQWQYSDGNTYARIAPYGQLAIGNVNPAIYANARISLNTVAADAVGMVIRSVSSQTANLTEWQNSSGTVLVKVDANGYIGSNGVYGTTGKWSLETAYGGGFMGLAKTTSAVANPGADLARMYLVAGTNAGTLKLVVRAGASGAETTILDNIPQS